MLAETGVGGVVQERRSAQRGIAHREQLALEQMRHPEASRYRVATVVASSGSAATTAVNNHGA
jgi:hypothetical protein